jgi:hypothetical protein
VIRGIVPVLKSGCRWCDCPERASHHDLQSLRAGRAAAYGKSCFREIAGAGFVQVELPKQVACRLCIQLRRTVRIIGAVAMHAGLRLFLSRRNIRESAGHANAPGYGDNKDPEVPELALILADGSDEVFRVAAAFNLVRWPRKVNMKRLRKFTEKLSILPRNKLPWTTACCPSRWRRSFPSLGQAEVRKSVAFSAPASWPQLVV